MYKKTHHRLTFVFTMITSLIVVFMSIFYLYMSEHTQWTNGKDAFSRDINTLISNFEHQSEISYEWLSKIESNGNYIIAAYDQKTPLAFNTRCHNEKERALIDEVYQYCKQYKDSMTSAKQSSAYTSVHQEFDYTSKSDGSYYICNASIAGQFKNVQVLVLSRSLQSLKQQFKMQRGIFFVIDAIVILILFLFCWVYTKKLLEPIEENQRKQTQFVASASHELRTPLAVILSSISAIKKADAKEQKHFFSVIESESHQMSELLGDMLTLASADAHSWEVAFAEVELDTLLLNCYESFTAVSRQKQVRFQIELPEEGIPVCHCDEKRIRQVLTILLHNAFSYSESGGLVKLSLSLTPEYFVLKVADHGKGISDEDKAHIFERFFRSSSAVTSQEHFGLGLCIAKEIVGVHQGSITVEDTISSEGEMMKERSKEKCSAAGKGTTFVVKLRR